MNLLIIEDSQDEIDTLKGWCDNQTPKIIVTAAKSKESAFESIANGILYDLVLLDLNLPNTDTSKDENNDNGISICYRLITELSGTPVIVFSGFATDREIARILREGRKIDIFGKNDVEQLLYFIKKDETPELLKLIDNFNRETSILNKISISHGMEKISLTDQEKRVLRIFARRSDAISIEISSLGGGLSSAKVLDVQLYNKEGHPICRAVGRVDNIPRISDEIQRYDRYIARLAIGKLAHKMHDVLAGAGNQGGIFYALAKDFTSNLFSVIQNDENKGIKVIDNLIANEVPWLDSQTAKNLTIREIRRSFVKDDVLNPYRGELEFDVDDFEDHEIRLKWCPQHCDLHGLNILVDGQLNPVLIDYGDVDLNCATIDPITLELSISFHPAANKIFGQWLTTEAATQWPDIDKYTESSPVPHFIKKCRQWAFESAKGYSDDVIYVVAYSHALRQLKYSEENRPLAIAIANSAAKKIMQSF